MNNIFRDEYTDFTFNGVQSSQMKVWITNSRDLQFRLTPEFSDTFITPSFSNTQILNSTNITKSTFSLKCIAINITMQDWRAIQGWLSPTAVGRLSFDFNTGTYYNAKIDKSISGTTFVKSGGNRNVSDRYIIEFTVGFTTVGDYAALGEVNVGVLEKNFGNTLETWDTESQDDDLKYKIESVSNNCYFMPSIIKLDNNILKEKTLTKINNRTLRFIPDGSAAPIANIIDFSVKDNNSFKSLYIISEHVNIIDGKSQSKIKVEKTVYQNGIQNTSLSQETFYDTEVKDGNNIVDINFFGEELFIFPLSDEVTWADSNNTHQYAVCNTGSYDMYPSLLLNTDNFSVLKNGEEIYNYELKIPAIISIDGQNGFILSQGQPIENISYKLKKEGTTYEYVLVNNWKNNGILNIKSGRPQLFKARFIEKSAVQYKYKTAADAEEESKEIGYEYTFISPEPLQYDHRNRTAVHIFQDIIGMQQYNTSTYPLFVSEGIENKYNIEFINSNYTTECRIECMKENGYYKYSVIVPAEDGGYNLISGVTYYISICDYDILDIDINDSTTNNFIYLQTRDAF